MNKSYGVVIAAGGSGTRFGGNVPKQFLDLMGIPVIAHTLSAFEKCREIDEIVIVSHKDYLVFCSDVVKEHGFTKVTSVIEGGNTRQASVFKGIKALDTEFVLIHDAARPLIEVSDISRCCKEVSDLGSCAIGVRVVDTIKESQDGMYISSTLDRSKLWQIQTPQCFKRDFIMSCHKKAAFDSFVATDDCMLAEKYGAKIKLIEGSRTNLKITEANDLLVAEVLISND